MDDAGEQEHGEQPPEQTRVVATPRHPAANDFNLHMHADRPPGVAAS
jgi:hypothetical protein